MDRHTARIFTRDTIYRLTGMVVPDHLWWMMPLREAGLSVDLLSELATNLGIRVEGLQTAMTLSDLADKVAAESPLQIQLQRRMSPLLML